MTNSPAWDPDALRNKAALYFQRAFAAEAEEEPDLFALWIHLGLELLLRAAIAKVHPALLSGPKRSNLMYGLGLDPSADPHTVSSATTAEVIDLCGELVEGFGPAETSVCRSASRRRNSELHSGTASMRGMERGWRGRTFAVCRVLASHLETSLEELFGTEPADLAERLIDEEVESVRKETQDSIEAARKRAAKLSAKERAEREAKAKAEFLPPEEWAIPPSPGPEKPRVLRQVACPACETPIVLRGEVIRRGSPRVDADGELVQTDVALPTLLDCPVCDLQISGVAKLTQAGLGDPTYVRDFLDPVDTFDVDLSNYQDEFLENLSYEREYEDE